MDNETFHSVGSGGSLTASHGRGLPVFKDESGRMRKRCLDLVVLFLLVTDAFLLALAPWDPLFHGWHD